MLCTQLGVRGKTDVKVSKEQKFVATGVNQILDAFPHYSNVGDNIRAGGLGSQVGSRPTDLILEVFAGRLIGGPGTCNDTVVVHFTSMEHQD